MWDSSCSSWTQSDDAEKNKATIASVATGQAPAARSIQGEPLAKPTGEESQETDIGSYAPIVPNPTMASSLACPAGTTQSTGEGVIECRTTGVPGHSLSKREGPSIWFHKNGKVKRAGFYEHHEWTGRWWEFDEEGRLESSTAYRAGKEDGVGVTFYANGKRRSETTYQDGKRHGPSKIWTEEGELINIATYENDGSGNMPFVAEAHLRCCSRSWSCQYRSRTEDGRAGSRG